MFSLQKYGGITKYFCELIKNYPNGYSFSLSLLTSNNEHLREDSYIFKKIYLPIPSKESKLKSILKDKNYKLNKQYSRFCLKRNKYDLFHPTYFDPYFLEFVKKPFVITVHDMIAFKFNEVYKKEYQMERMRKLIENATRIISVSENTKKDIVDILNINPDKVDVIHHGFNTTNRSRKANRFGRYILYVGTRLNYKNFSSLAKSFSRIVEKDKDLKLICVGPPFLPKEYEFLKKLKIMEKVSAMGVPENELNNLYFHALAFIYPTLYEGFGMPILEAFANNCPVCLSNTSSLPEVAGEAGAYFDPTDVCSITASIEKVIYYPEFSKKLIKEGNKRLNEFSWKKCAEKTTDTYKKVVFE